MTFPRAPWPAAVLAAALLAGACSSDGSTSPPPTEPIDTTIESTVDSTTPTPATTETEEAGPPIAFNGQGNDLAAYDDTGASQIVITNAGDDPDGRDINGQVCFLADGRFIAGEDTGQPDPPAGFGIFELEGERVGELEATQVGKLTPTYQEGDSGAEPYGCGVLADGRVVTTDVGNQASGPANGQVIVWFPPIEGTDVAYCKLDVAVGTAQQVAVDGDDVLVASARGETVGVQRYTDLPTGPTPEEGCDGTDSDGTPLVTAPDRTLFIDPTDGGLGLANGITASEDGWFVSAVIRGRINEYDRDGRFVRAVLEPAEGDVLDETTFETGTPLGIDYHDGVLWYADIGVVITPERIGPGDGNGAVRIIRFTDGVPGAPEVIDEGLDFPDAIGLRIPG